MTVNRRILLTARPDGLVTEDCLERVEEPVPEIGDGEVLVRVLALSVDPTNRVWMREEDSYLPAVRIGDVVRAAGLGEVVESRRDGYNPGDLVMGLPGWQDYWKLTGEDTGQVVPPGIAVGGHAEHLRRDRRHRVLRAARDRSPATGRDRRRVRRGRWRRVGRGPDRADQGCGARRGNRRHGREVSLGGGGPRLRRVHQLQDRGRRGAARGSSVPTGSTCTSTTSAARSSTRCCSRSTSAPAS